MPTPKTTPPAAEKFTEAERMEVLLDFITVENVAICQGGTKPYQAFQRTGAHYALGATMVEAVEGLRFILAQEAEGTAAPSAEAQLPQSSPDAPPVQRGVRTEAEDELIEGVIRWYEDPGNADKERAAMYFAKRVAKERIRFAKDDARAQKRRHHPMFGRKKDAPRPVMGIPMTTSVLPMSSQPTSRSEEGKVPAQEDVTIPQKALAHKGEGK